MRLFFNLIAIGFVFTSLSACNFLSRHPDSGYSYNGHLTPLHQQLEVERKAHKEAQARQELGLSKSSYLSEYQSMALNRRMKVQNEEKHLTTYREKKQYYFYKPLLKNDRERLYFLKLPSIDAKERFVQSRGLASVAKDLNGDVANLIEDNDISVGMTKQAVRESWGDPDLKEIAGNEVYGNVRWRYSKYVSSESGYQRETRYVYFENGVVSGWESF